MINKPKSIKVYITKDLKFKAHVTTLENKIFTVIVGGIDWAEDPKIQQYKKHIIDKCKNVIKTLQHKLFQTQTHLSMLEGYDRLPEFLKSSKNVYLEKSTPSLKAKIPQQIADVNIIIGANGVEFIQTSNLNIAR